MTELKTYEKETTKISKKAYWDVILLGTEEHKYLSSKSDKNTKFYHALTKQRHVQNLFIGLHDKDGQWVTLESKVKGGWRLILSVIYLNKQLFLVLKFSLKRFQI